MMFTHIRRIGRVGVKIYLDYTSPPPTPPTLGTLEPCGVGDIILLLICVKEEKEEGKKEEVS